MKRFVRYMGITILMNIAPVAFIHPAGDAGSAGVQQSTSLEPSYAALEEGAGKYRSKVFDEKSVVDLCEISFFGHTTVGGVRKEADDSMNKLDLAFIKEIIVKKSDYDSKRYSDRSFSLVTIITDTGVAVEDLLVPKHVIICGREKDTHVQKSWFLNKISRVLLEQPTETGKAVSAKDYVEKIFKKDISASSKAVASLKEVEPIKEDVAEMKKEVARVKRETDEVRREADEVKQKTEEATRDIAQMKEDVAKSEAKKEVIVVKEVVRPAVPPKTSEKLAKSEHKTVRDAFGSLVTAVVDFVKAIVNGVLQLFPR